MSPFKVIRCRYYSLEGKPIPPYCSAGRHCTFLHPKDKAWPGGDFSLGNDKRPEERDRTFPPNRPDRLSVFSHDKRSYKADAPPKVDVCVSENQVAHKRHSHAYQDNFSPVHTIVEIFRDIAKSQIKLTQAEEAIEKTAEKLDSFRELSKSLSLVSAASAAAITPTIDAIVEARNELQRKYDQDSKQLAALWDRIFDTLYRATGRQVDKEVESGIEYLHQEARNQVKTIERTVSRYHLDQSTRAGSVVASTSRTMPLSGRSNASQIISGGSMKEAASQETYADEKKVPSIDQSVSTPDDTYGRKRRRVSSEDEDNDRKGFTEASHPAIKEAITELQKQFKEQRETLVLLSRRNEELESTIRHYSSIISTMQTPNVDSNTDKLHSCAVSDDQLSKIRDKLREDLLAVINPAFENQKILNENWEARLVSLCEELRGMNAGMDDSWTTSPTTDIFREQ